MTICGSYRPKKEKQTKTVTKNKARDNHKNQSVWSYRKEAVRNAFRLVERTSFGALFSLSLESLRRVSGGCVAAPCPARNDKALAPPCGVSHGFPAKPSIRLAPREQESFPGETGLDSSLLCRYRISHYITCILTPLFLQACDCRSIFG